MRTLPPGVGPTNSLPKARVFHLHDESGVALLENLLVMSKKNETLAGLSPEPTVADHLDSLGEKIDRESFKITGGLLIIGGAVALANPFAGAGIAAKALFPSIGAKASRMGLELAGEKLRHLSEKKRDRKVEKAAKREVKNLEPELYLNPLLIQLEQAVSTSETTHDPLIANPHLVDEFPNARYLRVSVRAIVSIYEEALGHKASLQSLNLHRADLAWFDHLKGLIEAMQDT